jgi:GT2 family glycosyltransferase
MTSSVLIPSFGRPALLERCLRALARQTVAPDELIVVWQGDDTATRDRAEELAASLAMTLHVVHLAEPGIVPAENAALDRARGEIILLLDDDAVAHPDWVERHLAHYDDPSVGAVGGPGTNFDNQGRQYPARSVEPFGRITWFGRFIGNMYDHPESWRSRPAVDVDHLVGYNLSFRRAAFDRFEDALKRYWQLFEADACLQVRSRGFRVVFDPAIVIEHRMGYATSVYTPGREGDLTAKVANAAYNTAFVLAKHTSGPLQRAVRWLYLVGVGTQTSPGPLLLPLTIRRNGRPGRELTVARMVLASKREGWRDGRRRRIAEDGARCGIPHHRATPSLQAVEGKPA